MTDTPGSRARMGPPAVAGDDRAQGPGVSFAPTDPPAAADDSTRPQDRSPPENPGLVAALRQASITDDGSGERRIARELVDARLLVAASGRRRRGAELILLAAPQLDGRPALLAFTDQDALDLWRPQANFIAARAPGLARYALESGPGALTINAAGPISATLGEGELRPLASGGLPLAPAQDGQVRLRGASVTAPDDLVAAIEAALGARGEVAAAYLLEPHSEEPRRTIIGLVVDAGAPSGTVGAIVEALGEVLRPVASTDRDLGVVPLSADSVAALRGGGVVPVFERA